MTIAPFGRLLPTARGVPAFARRAVEDSLVASFEDRGIRAGLSPGFDAALRRAATDVGGVADPVSGAPIASRVEEVARRVLADTPGDLLVLVGARSTSAELFGRLVEYAGRREIIEGVEGGTRIRGAARGLVLVLEIRNVRGERVYEDSTAWLFPWVYKDRVGPEGLEWSERRFEAPLRHREATDTLVNTLPIDW